MTNRSELPIPAHARTYPVHSVRPVKYGEIASAARKYAADNAIGIAASDTLKVCLVAIDCQLTFCHPDFELYVGGRSGTGALDDMARFTGFIYRNLSFITSIVATLDTHRANQIFFDIFFVDSDGKHPTPLASELSVEALESGRWRANPAAAAMLGMATEELQAHVLHYARELARSGKFSLTIWPYHAMLGGIGHALVPAVEEAIFFHSQARQCSARYEMKGSNPLTENYSVLRPEVLTGADGNMISEKNRSLIDWLLSFDRLIVAGEAKSHCVAWTIEDLLNEIRARDPALASKVYLLEDCTSAVVVPGVVDFTDEADAAYARFAGAGMHLVKSTDPISSWPEF